MNFSQLVESELRCVESLTESGKNDEVSIWKTIREKLASTFGDGNGDKAATATSTSSSGKTFYDHIKVLFDDPDKKIAELEKFIKQTELEIARQEEIIYYIKNKPLEDIPDYLRTEEQQQLYDVLKKGGIDVDRFKKFTIDGRMWDVRDVNHDEYISAEEWWGWVADNHSISDILAIPFIELYAAAAGIATIGVAGLGALLFFGGAQRSLFNDIKDVVEERDEYIKKLVGMKSFKDASEMKQAAKYLGKISKLTKELGYTGKKLKEKIDSGKGASHGLFRDGLTKKEREYAEEVVEKLGSNKSDQFITDLPKPTIRKFFEIVNKSLSTDSKR